MLHFSFQHIGRVRTQSKNKNKIFFFSRKCCVEFLGVLASPWVMVTDGGSFFDGPLRGADEEELEPPTVNRKCFRGVIIAVTVDDLSQPTTHRLEEVFSSVNNFYREIVKSRLV